MKKIKSLVFKIDDELESAKDYAEYYIELKADGDINLSNKYKEMANDELRHATTIHEEAVALINKFKAVSTPPEDMQERWNREHRVYIEKSNWIKLMLNT